MPFNPDPQGKPTFRPQFPIRIEDLREIAYQAQSAVRTGIYSSDISESGSGAGTQVASELLPPGFYARLTAPPIITDPTNCLYNFCEVLDDGTGEGWISIPGCLQGTFVADPNHPPGTYNSYPIDGNPAIAVPGPPINLSVTPPGASFYYVVTTIWTNNTSGSVLQSGVSLEVSSSGLGVLTWTAPAPVTGYTLTGYSIWRGVVPGGENVLLADVSASTTSYTDTGSGVTKSPILGGNAGPIVWMLPFAAWRYFKFIDTTSTPQLPLAWIKVTSTLYQQIYLNGRQASDGIVTSGSNILTSVGLALTSADLNKIISGPGIPSQRFVVDATTTSGSNIVGSTDANFVNATWPFGDVGAVFSCNGVGATTITSVTSPSTATVAVTASETLYNQVAEIGSNTTISSVNSSLNQATMSQVATQNLSSNPVTISSCSILGFPAILDAWQSPPFLLCQFVDEGSTVWFTEVNGRVPNVNERYQCRSLGSDISGITLWATRFHGCSTYLIGPFTTTENTCQEVTNYIVVPYGEICQAFVSSTASPLSPAPPPICVSPLVTSISCSNGVLQFTTQELCVQLSPCGEVATVFLQNPVSNVSGGVTVTCPPPGTSPGFIPFFGNDW